METLKITVEEENLKQFREAAELAKDYIKEYRSQYIENHDMDRRICRATLEVIEGDLEVVNKSLEKFKDIWPEDYV